MGRTLRTGNATEAGRLARDAHGGFVPVKAAFRPGRQTALVAGRDGDFVLLREHGAHVVARILRDVPDVTLDDAILTVTTGE